MHYILCPPAIPPGFPKESIDTAVLAKQISTGMIAWRKVSQITMTNEEYSRPATINDLKTIIQSLNDHNVPYILIGGYALFAHGYHRATEDIDILIPQGITTGKLVKKALMVLSDQSARELEDEWFNEDDNIRLADEVVVDILFNACGETYDSLKNHIQTIDLDGTQVNTLDLYGLLKTKNTVREKDISDRLILERVLKEIDKNTDS